MDVLQGLNGKGKREWLLLREVMVVRKKSNGFYLGKKEEKSEKRKRCKS